MDSNFLHSDHENMPFDGYSRSIIYNLQIEVRR